mmetsp:Transcript_23227/g.27465  ORF Transcript_23227/g.27465 Transcript_23227/m.27465 type:complete len:103 (+) Transcript_23227:827-1135(+)
MATDLSQAAKAMMFLQAPAVFEEAGGGGEIDRGSGNEKREQNHHRLKNSVGSNKRSLCRSKMSSLFSSISISKAIRILDGLKYGTSPDIWSSTLLSIIFLPI